jgi:hypothetical protein
VIVIRIRVGEGQRIAFGRDDDGRDRVDKWKRSEEKREKTVLAKREPCVSVLGVTYC